MFCYKRAQELSGLARGRGLMDGGVEINCLADDRRAFSLSGQSLLLPSNSRLGRNVTPYRPHKLALPKTFVTKRGPMVLFTSQEDMIIGKSCQIHHKEARYKTASGFNSKTDLFNTTLDYDAEKDSGISDGENVCGDECGTTYPGHFTNVYLRSLQQTVQKTRQLSEDIVVEDVETKEIRVDSELPLASECDSGIGHSGRLSAISHHSDGTIINIPDGQESQDSRLSFAEEHAYMGAKTDGELPARMDAVLSELKQELSQYTVKQVKGNGAKRRATKPGKKRAKAHESSKHQTKVANEELKPTKSKRKLRKKSKKEETSVAKISPTFDANDGVTPCSMPLDQELNATQITAIQMAPDNLTVEHSVTEHQQPSKAEQRRLEIERKRAEKKRLERLKEEEEEKNISLHDLLNEPVASPSFSSIIAEKEEEDHPIVQESQSVLTQLAGDRQQALLAELEEAKLREQRLLLAYNGDSIEKSLCETIDSADESMKKAKEAEERYRDAERLKLEQEQERRKHSNNEHSVVFERLHRLQDNRRMKPEVVCPKSTSRPYVYSYFRYVPPKVKAGHEVKQKKPKERSRHQK